MFGPQIFLSNKILDPKKNKVQPNFWSKKFFGLNKFWVQKNSGSKNFGSEKSTKKSTGYPKKSAS